MKNAKALLLVSFLSVSGIAVAGCESCAGHKPARTEKPACKGPGCPLEATASDEESADVRTVGAEDQNMDVEQEDVNNK